MKEILSALDSIHPLSDELKYFLSQKLILRSILKKEFLFLPGKCPGDFYYIEKGILHCRYNEKGKDISSFFIKEKDILLYPLAFSGTDRNQGFMHAIEDSLVWYISYGDLEFIYKNFSEFNTITRKLFINAIQLSEERSRLIRMKQAVERYKAMLQFFPELILRVPAKYLASYLGMSPGTLSRIRSRK